MTITEADRPGALRAAPEPSQEELLRRAEVIARKARDRADETDRAGNVLPDLVQEMKDTELFRLVQPKRWGGFGRPWIDLIEVSYVISQGCPSTGWVYNVLAHHPWFVALLPEEGQAEVWSEDPSALVSSAFLPIGQAEPVAGGFRLSGRFPFSSGSDHAPWGMVGALSPGADGQPAPMILAAPMSQFTKLNDWNTIGLQPTRSQTLTCENLFVPSCRSVVMPPFMGSSGQFAIQVATVGAATGGVKAYINDIKSKPGKNGAPPPSQSEHIQVEAAAAWGEVSAAWELLRQSVIQSEAIAPMGTLMPLDQQIKNRAIGAVITRLCLSAMDRVFNLSGGHGAYLGPVSRAMRDVRVGAQHVNSNPYAAAREAGANIFRA